MLGTEIDIGRFVYMPNKDIIALAIFFKPEAIEKVGVLHEITKIFLKYNIPITHLIFSRPVLGRKGKALLFLDITNKVEILDNIINEVKVLEYIENVKLIKPLFKGFVSDTYFFPLVVGNYRAIIFRKPLYEALIKEWQKAHGDLASIFLYHIGLMVGAHAFEDHVRTIGERDVNKLISLAEALFRNVGFGIMKLYVNTTLKEAKVIVRNSFECELFKGSDKPRSNFIRGFIAGWCSKLLEKEVNAKEISCIAKGDEYCEFIVR